MPNIDSMISEYEEIDNRILIRDNLLSILGELKTFNPKFYGIAKEAHDALYRSMIEALRGTSNQTVSRKRDPNREVKYKLGNNLWKLIRKVRLKNCKIAWRYSSPVVCEEPSNDRELKSWENVDDFLISFWDALAMIQAENYMHPYIHSRPVHVSDSEMEILEWLHEEFRGRIEHFMPTSWSIHKNKLLKPTQVCIKLIYELLYNSGLLLEHKFPDDLKEIIREINTKIANLNN